MDYHLDTWPFCYFVFIWNPLKDFSKDFFLFHTTAICKKVLFYLNETVSEKKVKSLSRVWLFATPWTVAYQAVPSMGFSRQEYWRGVPLPSPLGSRAQGQYLWYMGLAASWHVGSTWIRDWPMSPALVSGFFTTEPPGKPDIENLLYSRRCTRPLE